MRKKYENPGWKVVWEDQPEIGYHIMHIEDAEGNEVRGTDIWLRDYTGPVQRDLRKGTRYENVAFEIGYVCGYSYGKSYEFSENRTLEDMKRECEQYIAFVLNSRIKNAKETLAETEPVCRWFNEWIIDNHYRECSVIECEPPFGGKEVCDLNIRDKCTARMSDQERKRYEK